MKNFDIIDINGIISFLEKNRIFYQINNHNIILFPSKYDEETVTIDTKNKKIKIYTFIKEDQIEDVEKIEFDWKDNNFSFRIFKNNTFVVSCLFYKMRRNF